MSTFTPSAGALADPRPDAELVALVRDGNLEAFGVLYGRHAAAAHRLARQLAPGPDADDLVADAFDKVLDVTCRGGGPHEAFRAYLLTALRRLHVDRLRAGARAEPTDDLEPHAPGVPFTDTAVTGFESGAAARAFASLPERWQLVLWHTEVEGQKPAEVAPLLGISANSVAALAYRAREGLRQAFLTMHAQEGAEDDCGRVVGLLGGFVRGGLSRRDRASVRSHLDECRRCTGIYLELSEVNAGIGAVLAPALLGGAGAAYVGGALGSGVAAAAGGVATSGAAPVLLAQMTSSALSRGREVLQNAGAAATSAGAGVAVGVATTLAVIGGGVLAIQQDDPDSGQESRPEAGPGGPEGPGPGRDGGSDGGDGGGGDGGGDGAGRPDPAEAGGAPADASAAPPSAAQPEPGPPSGGGSGSDGGGDDDGDGAGPPPDRDLRVRASAERDAVDFRVRVAVAGLGPDDAATVTLGADEAALVVGLDQRCDPVAVGGAQCRVSAGSPALVLRARPLPDRRTTMRFEVAPEGGTRDTRTGNESAAVVLVGRLAG